VEDPPRKLLRRTVREVSGVIAPVILLLRVARTVSEHAAVGCRRRCRSDTGLLDRPSGRFETRVATQHDIASAIVRAATSAPLASARKKPAPSSPA